MKSADKVFRFGCGIALVVFFVACSTPTSSESGGIDCPNCTVKKSSTSAERASSSSGGGISSSADSSLALSVTWVNVGGFSISQTEIMQSDYRKLMGTLPRQMAKATGDSFPVANVSFYEAILFANELSKSIGFDTAYSYESRGAGDRLENLKTDDSVKAVRLPNGSEWEYAYRAGTSSAYYWGTAVASDYAVYNNLFDSYQKVARKLSNAWNLYDMAGNVAEWTSDTTLRGGDWTSVAKELAARESKKKMPDFASNGSGIRVILSGE